ncbi:hypothetical protein AIIKEEIJ_02143 [Rhodococcus sp. YH1]|nr:hypothetical protein [Rhodococcus sp. YH1]
MPPEGVVRPSVAANSTVSWDVNAESISPSSMRKPRTLTWKSLRPTNSSSSRSSSMTRQRTMSPVRYIRAPSAVNGSATNRSEVSTVRRW